MGGRRIAVEGAVLYCTEGTSQAPLLATCRTAKFGGMWAGNIHDFKPGTNIPSFGTCKKKNAPCTPDTCQPWTPILQTVSLWQPVPVLSEGAILPCNVGGIITILYGGQNAISIAVRQRANNMCLPLPPGAARGGRAGGDNCGADYGAGNACGAAAGACGVNVAVGTACGADASACGAAASGATACGANASACGAAASGASACGAAASACGAAASGATACGAALGVCGVDAAGAEACGVQSACAIDACGADACVIDLTIADASPVDVCAIDILPVIPFV